MMLTLVLTVGLAQTEALACFERASEELRLSEDGALALCQGARTMAPATCYARADTETRLSEQLKVALCRCAESNAPVDCVLLGDDETELTDPDLVSLCSPVSAEYLSAACLPLAPQPYIVPAPPAE